MKKVCVIGHFGNGKNLLNGQTIKTKIITEGLIKALGEDEVSTIDTHGGAKALPRCFLQLGLSFIKCKNVIMLPAHNGVRIFTPILLFWKALFHRRLHYVVIGGWLPDYLKDKPRLAKQLKKFDGIYVETSTMKKAMEVQGFENLHILPNCKDLHILSEDELVYCHQEPYKLCTFSRVLKEKGIEDAVKAVKSVNESYGRIVFLLDIYGQVDANQITWFENLKTTFPDYISYKGQVSFDKTTEVLKDYYALLFPTRFYTEGIPGTIIDAYAAGIPVVAARWESFEDIIADGEVGKGYSFGDLDELVDILKFVVENPDCLLKMKNNCMRFAEKYRSDNVISEMIRVGIK